LEEKVTLILIFFRLELNVKVDGSTLIDIPIGATTRAV